MTMRLVRLRVVIASLLLSALTGLAGVAAAQGIRLELIHPQSDDQGHYIAFAAAVNATVFGTVAPAEQVRAVYVNEKKAQLFPGELLPFGAPASEKCLEFRATIEAGPTTKIAVRVDGEGAPATHVVLAPDTAAAMARLRQLVEGQPESARNRCRIGGALRDQGKLEEAIDELRKSLSLNMSCVDTRVTLGKALVQVGRPEEALTEFTLATETAPDYAMAWLQLGLLHARFTRNTQEAIRCFKRYLQLEPNISIADKVRRYVEAQSHP